MLIKCNCNNCSTHIEFEAGNEGTLVTCPACNMETLLYAPPPAPPQTPPPPPPQKSSNPPPRPSLNEPPTNSGLARDALSQVRSHSCYRTLRSLIGIVQDVWIAISLLFVVAQIVFVIRIGHVEGGPSFTVIQLIYSVIAACLSIALAVAIKQAALLLVDIADCQIQSLMRSKQRPS